MLVLDTHPYNYLLYSFSIIILRRFGTMSSQALSTVVDEKVLQSVLKENRAVALYTNYTTSSEHKTFMSGSKMMSVSLPRSEWHAHRNYRRNPQMPEVMS